MPKVLQKLLSAIGTDSLIAGVGWGDMFHLVIYFRRFLFTSPFSKYSKRDEVVFVKSIVCDSYWVVFHCLDTTKK